ncbi:MAG: DUF885 domain-containing protein [Lachnospira sp.]|nr:DUF885 domain-containing protein [Lachnospira sp.]
MKHTIKKLTALLLILCMIMSTVGCFGFDGKFSNETESEQENNTLQDVTDDSSFNEFIDELFRDTVTTDTITLHSFVQNPANYGITDYDITLGRYNLEDLDGTADITECINKLQSFDRESLSEQQQITYDQLLKYLQNELEFCDLYWFSTSLSPTIGLQVQLPIVYAEYSLNEEKDVKEYIKLLEDTDEFFKNVIDYETLRSKNGYFMEDCYVDDIVKQCEEFINSADDGYLISTFDTRVDALTGLSDEAKKTYKEQNKNAVKDHVIKGYQILVDGLKKLKGTNEYKGGLCNYPNGKKFFEYLIDDHMGWNKSVDDYDKLLDKHISKNMLAMQGLMLNDSTLLDKFDSFKFSITDPNAMLEDLKKRITVDFPASPTVNYSVKEITKALQDYASPAMYFIPQIDNFKENSIYINPAHSDNSTLYTTMAHEGYPGHLYQTTYFMNSNPDLIRTLIKPGGYVEGWATYVELMSYGYADSGSAELNTLMALNQAVILCMYAKVDIGVNYHNWSADDVYNYIAGYGFADREIAQEMYDAMVTEPANYCQYVLGFLGFCELKNSAQTKLGDKFVLKDFHQYILDMGPVQFDILFERLDAWVEKKK